MANQTTIETTDAPKVTRRYNKTGRRAVLVNLDLELAERYHAAVKSLGSNATKKTKELIEQFLAENKD